MDNKGYSSFSESEAEKGADEGGHMRCKSLYDEWKCPAYYPYHSYQKNKAKSVSPVMCVLFCKINHCFHMVSSNLMLRQQVG